MKKLSYVQLESASGELLTVSGDIWRRFITEVNENDGIFESDDEISMGFAKRVAVQGSRSDMHFELVFDGDAAVGIVMFAVDTGTVYGLLERGLETVMGVTFVRNIADAESVLRFGVMWKLFFWQTALSDFTLFRIWLPACRFGIV